MRNSRATICLWRCTALIILQLSLSLFFSVLPPLASLVYVKALKRRFRQRHIALAKPCLHFNSSDQVPKGWERERTLLLQSCVCQWPFYAHYGGSWSLSAVRSHWLFGGLWFPWILIWTVGGDLSGTASFDLSIHRSPVLQLDVSNRSVGTLYWHK